MANEPKKEDLTPEQQRMRALREAARETGRQRLDDAVSKGKKNYMRDAGEFQKEKGAALLDAIDRIPPGQPRLNDAGRIPDEKLRAIEDYGHARGFMKVNPDPPHNLYEDMHSPEANRPAERFVKEKTDFGRDR